MAHFDPWQMSGQRLTTRFDLRGTRLAQRCGRELGLEAHGLE